jgi:hypothetical protein
VIRPAALSISNNINIHAAERIPTLCPVTIAP